MWPILIPSIYSTPPTEIDTIIGLIFQEGIPRNREVKLKGTLNQESLSRAHILDYYMV